MTKPIITAKTINTVAVGELTVSTIELAENDHLFGRRGKGVYYVCTLAGGSAHSGYCKDAVEALTRTSALKRHGNHQAAEISQAPEGSANEAEMAVAISKFDGGLAIRDGGMCERAVRAGAAAGLLSPEWVVASVYISECGLWF